MKKTLRIIVILGLITGGIYLFNFFSLTQPTQKELENDPRNEGVEIRLHYKFFISTNTLIYNLKNVSGDKSAVDVFRVLLQTCSSLKEKQFKMVILAYKGKSKFSLDGAYFKKLGKEYEFQNPVYTTRTFPEHVMDINGNPIYDQWTGGILGVLNKQMEDFNDFCEKWYIDEVVEEHKYNSKY